MRKIINKALIMIAFAALSFGYSYSQTATGSKPLEQDSNIVSAKIVTSAECDQCKERIENAVNKIDGVTFSNLDVDTKVLTIKYHKDFANLDAIRKTISRVGYDADDVPANKRSYSRLPKCCQKGGHSKP